jgi:hypothetical protein
MTTTMNCVKPNNPIITNTSYDDYKSSLVYDKHNIPTHIIYENKWGQLPPLPLQSNLLPPEHKRNKVSLLIDEGRWKELYDEARDVRKFMTGMATTSEFKKNTYDGFETISNLLVGMTFSTDYEAEEEKHIAVSTELGTDIWKEVEQIQKYIRTKRKKFEKNGWCYSFSHDKDYYLEHYDYKKLKIYGDYLEHYIVKHNIAEDNCRAPPKECSICLGQCLHTKLRCGHSFGDECLKKWLKENRKCPMCRASALPKQCIKI